MNHSYKGKILISTPDISGDFFSRAVVLIIEHNHEGAFGFILNKNSLPKRVLNIRDTKIDIYEGGPVEPNKNFVIAKGTPIVENYMMLDDTHYLTEDVDRIVKGMAQNEITLDQFKLLSGYSGWSAMQLDSEIDENYWLIADYVSIDYLSANGSELWKKIMQNLGGEYLIWANSPADISMN